MQQEDIKIIGMTFVNAFLISADDGFVLIDTGLPMFWDKLETELLDAGCLPGKLKLVVLTHGDFDHAGNCARLQDKYKSRIAMHKDDAPMVEQGVVLKRKVRVLRARIFSIIRKLSKSKFSLEKFSPDIFLTDGQSLSEYGLDATVLHIPGHTPGSIGILTKDGTFFAGDTFTNRRHPDTATYIENPGQLKDSLEHLKKMSIKTVFPGHGMPFEIEALSRKS